MMDPLRKRFFVNGRPVAGSTLHAQYLKPANTLLNAVKQRMQLGNLQQLAQRYTTEDGATLTAISRFGQDEIRIDLPFRHGAVAAEQPQTREELDVPLDDFLPYLWIGAKLVSGGLNEEGTVAVKIHLCVWEPGVQADLSGEAEILSNRHRFVGNEPDTAIYPLQNNELVDDPDPDAVIPEGEEAPPQIALTASKFYERQNGKDAADPASEWDEIAVCDPADPYFKGRIKSGTYQIKLMMVGADCPNITPSRVRLRVRVGKGVHARMREEEIEIAEVTNYHRGIVPLGWYDPFESQCSGIADNGPNPHAPHWWQGAALAYVPDVQIRVPAETLRLPAINFKASHIPDVGFVPGAFPSKAERCPQAVKVLWGGIGTDQVSGEYCVSPGASFKYCGSGNFDDVKLVIVGGDGALPYVYLGCGETDAGLFAAHYTGVAPSIPSTTTAKWYGFTGAELTEASIPTWGASGSCSWGLGWQVSHPTGGNYLMATAYYRADTNAWTILPGLVPFAAVEAIVKAELGVNRVCLYSDTTGGPCAI